MVGRWWFGLFAAASLYSQPLIEGPFVIFVGAPGSGKSTQAARLGKELRLPAISAENMVASHPGAFGKSMRPGLTAPEPRSEAVMNNIFGALIASGALKRGLIVDGYPATKEHADYIRGLVLEHRVPNPIIIQLDVPDEIVRKRMAKQDKTILEQRLKDYHREMDMLQAYFPRADLHVVDASRKPGKVAKDVREIVRASLSL